MSPLTLQVSAVKSASVIEPVSEAERLIRFVIEGREVAGDLQEVIVAEVVNHVVAVTVGVNERRTAFGVAPEIIIALAAVDRNLAGEIVRREFDSVAADVNVGS